MKSRSRHVARKRIGGIDVDEHRFVSVSGPPLRRLPGWGLLRRTDGCGFHLHPPIAYEVHYRVPSYVMVHAFTGGAGRGAIGDGLLTSRNTVAGSTRTMAPETQVRIIQSIPMEFLALEIAPLRFQRIADRATGNAPWRIDQSVVCHDASLDLLFREVRRVMIAEPVCSDGYIDTLADAAIARLATTQLAATSAGAAVGRETLTPMTVRRLAAEIEARLEHGVRVGDLEDIVGLSRAHFSRAFRRSFGATAQSYIMSRRIARARTLLEETELSATSIAMRCGFANPSHLTTSFRKEMGLTPTAYRQALSGGRKS